ncbi:MAG: Rieske (2Fe-2S) protein [Candidatus Obscuribacterales bacterium]|nr:Rieske (2Fe-2S) protein [Candidatus Obscuribacterales bacterium]
MKPVRHSEGEPLWKDEFSIESAHETFVNRRQFTKFLTLTSLAMFVGNLWILGKAWLYRKPVFPRQAIANASEIPVGGTKLFAYPNAEDRCIMVRTNPDTFVAYSQKCTHLSCPVYFSKEKSTLECPCHEGSFAIETGEVLKGPPPRPLPRVILEQENGLLIATGIKIHE